MALLFKRWLAKSFPSDKLLDSLQLRPIVKQKERLAEIKNKVFKVENSSSSPASPQTAKKSKMSGGGGGREKAEAA